MLVPAETVAVTESFGDLLHGASCSERQLKCARQKGRAILVGKRECLLFGQAEARGSGIVGHIAARSLRRKPFADVTLIRARAFRELRGGHRAALRQRLVKSEFVADLNERGVERCAKINQTSA